MADRPLAPWAASQPPIVLPIDQWPEIDRRLIQAAFEGSDDLEREGAAVFWREATRTGVKKGWGRYLMFLVRHGELDAGQSPCDRVTPALYQAYLRDLLAFGNSHNTIQTRCMELKMALDAMEPDRAADFAWITRPAGKSIRSWLPATVHRKPMIYAPVLWQWGMAFIDNADAEPDAVFRARAVRDGLIICVLAALAPRASSMVRIRVGDHLTRTRDAYHILYTGSDMKAGRALDYDLPAPLNAALDHYLDVERKILLDGETHDFLWVSTGGGAMHQDGLEAMIRRRVDREFGIAMGPHRFRDSLATACINMLPGSPGLGAAILGTSAGVVEAVYARADAAAAGRAYVEALTNAKAASAALASKAFTRR